MVPTHLISPNIHVILVHFPLGIFAFGLFLEIFSFLWRKSSVRVAAHWMLLFGGLMAVPTALSGIDALDDVRAHSLRQTLTDVQWGYMQKHVLWTSIGAGLAAVGVTIGLGLSDRWRRRLYIPLLLVLVSAAGLLTFGSHFGGEGIYLEGVAVKLRSKRPAQEDPQTATLGQRIEFVAPARSTHVLLAGLGMAVALGSVGASLRKLSTIGDPAADAADERELAELERHNAPAGYPPPRRVTDDISVARTLNADAELPLPRMAAARFWLLGSLLFLMAFGFGVWVLISVEGDPATAKASPRWLYETVKSTATATVPFSNNRRGVHIFLGGALVVLPLLLAIAVRWMARAKWLVTLLCLLMVAVVGAEVWLGVLLIYRGSEGPMLKFTQPEKSDVESNASAGRILTAYTGPTCSRSMS